MLAVNFAIISITLYYYFLYNSLDTSSAEPIVGVSGYFVGNSLLSKFGSEQLINKNNGNINISFLIVTITPLANLLLI